MSFKASRGAWILLCLPLIAGAFPGSSLAANPPVDQVWFAPARGAALPLSASFLDEQGAPARLADYLRGRPIIVVPGYYTCSNLCSVVLDSLRQALAAGGLRTGSDVDVVAFSISPTETPDLALARKRALLGAQDQPEASGWHFLTGASPSIARLTQALGYHYAYDRPGSEFAHPAGIVIVAQDGRVAGTLYGVNYPPAVLRRAVREAAPTLDVATPAGPVSIAQNAANTASAPGPESALASVWLLCFHYDPRAGRYDAAAMILARALALAALAALAIFLVRSLRAERRGVRRGGER